MVFKWLIGQMWKLQCVCGVDLFGGLLVILLWVWVREPHSVCTPCTPEGYIHCWLTGLFPWLPLQVSALFATAKSSVEVYENVSESDFWCRGFKRKPSEQLRHAFVFERKQSPRALCGNLSVLATTSLWKWNCDGKYDVTELQLLIKISKIILRFHRLAFHWGWRNPIV